MGGHLEESEWAQAAKSERADIVAQEFIREPRTKP
jgi:hypothetical protein